MRPRLHRLAAFAVACIGLLTAPVLAGQQAGKPPPATGLILGRVVEATTNEPVRDAIVQMVAARQEVDMVFPIGGGESQPIAVLTDSDGQFVFTGLSAGNYRLWARRSGYQEAPYGARRPNDSGEPLTIRDGERRADLVVRIWKYAAITGTVTDEFGEPVVGAAVRAFARANVAGHMRLGMNVGNASTDDRGVFRLPRLLPGEYIVGVIRSERSAPAALVEAQQRLMAAGDRGGAGTIGEALSIASAYVAPPGTTDSVRLAGALIGLAPPVPPASADGWMTYPTQFFPGVPGVASARPVAVRSGEEITSIDFRLSPVPTRAISGTLTGTDGPVARFPVLLLPAGATEFQMERSAPAHTTMTDDTGRFVFPAVVPGEYVVRALRGVGGGVEVWTGSGVASTDGGVVISSGDWGIVSAMAPPAAKPEPTRYATTPIAVGNRNVSNVSMTLALGAPFSGRIEFVGRKEPATDIELQAIGVVVEAIDGRVPGFEFEMTGRADRDGKFETVGLPAGRYFVRVPRVPDGWTLEAVLYAGRDVSDNAIDVGSAAIGGLVIRLTERPAVLAGTVRASGSPQDFGRALVVAFPTNRALWRDYGSTPRRLVHAGISADGSYQLRGLPPGEYFVVAIRDDFIRDWRTPAILEGLAPSAARVTIATGGRSAQAVTLVDLPAGGR